MRKRTMLAALAVLIAVMMALTSCGGSASYKGRVPARLMPVGAFALPEAGAGEPAPMFHFRAQPHGALLVYFGYVSCPDACPTTLSDVRRVLHALGPDSARVDVAFATVDLSRDTPEVMVPYLRHFIAAGHALVPAREEQLAAAQVAFSATSNVTRTRKGEVEVSHTGDLYLVDSRGNVGLIWRFGTKRDDIAEDLRMFLAREAQK
jgi:protein SCO1/2